MVDVVDCFHFRVATLHNFIKAHAAKTGKARVEASQRLHVSFRTHMLVTVEDHSAHLVFHGHDRLAETAFFPGLRCAALAFYSEGVDVIAGEAVFRRDEVRANALRCEVGFQSDAWVCRPCAAIRAHWDAGHCFNAAADSHVSFAGHDLRCSHVAGFKA